MENLNSYSSFFVIFSIGFILVGWILPRVFYAKKIHAVFALLLSFLISIFLLAVISAFFSFILHFLESSTIIQLSLADPIVAIQYFLTTGVELAALGFFAIVASVINKIFEIFRLSRKSRT